MHQVWRFNSAGSIVFGNGAINQLPGVISRFGSTKVAIITDPGIVKAGLLKKVTDIIQQAGLNPYVYDEAMPEPSMSSMLNCYTQLELHQPQLIIALGGGSCIDLAKITSLLLTHGGHPSDYFGEHKVPGKIRPIIAIPTTAGTGSDVSPVAIVTDEETNLKVGISDNYLRPAISLLDPELTLRLPEYITACTGMDALSQAIEAYFAKDYRYIEAEEGLIYQGSNPMSDHFAEKGIQLIGQNIRVAVHQGSNLEARSNMMLGNLYSALAFTNSGTSLIHALAYPIAEKTKKPHGEIIGLLLPYVVKYNVPACPEKFATIAELLDNSVLKLPLYEKIETSIDSIFKLLHDLGMPIKLSQIGIKREQVQEIVDTSLSIERLIKINPRTPSVKDVESILYCAL